MCELTDEDRELEQATRAAVWAMAETIPPGCNLSVLAVGMVRSMGDVDDKQKVSMLASSYVAALKMIAELVPDPENQN